MPPSWVHRNIFSLEVSSFCSLEAVMSQSKLLMIACMVGVVMGATRSLSLRNSCPDTVRVGFTAGAIPSTSCSSSSDCPSSGICSADTKLCYYPSFLPDGYLDLQKGESRSLNISVSKGDLYSGAVFVSTGCNTYQNACETGICRDKHCALTAGAIHELNSHLILHM